MTELRRSTFYNDFFRPRGIRYADYQTVSIARGRAAGFAVNRRHRDFSGDDHDLFEHLRGTLSAIWSLVSRVEALDSVPTPSPDQRLTEPLTPAERRVSALVLRGLRTMHIAQALGVSPKAVEQHLTHIYRKAAVTSRAEYLLLGRSGDPHTGDRATGTVTISGSRWTGDA